MLAVEVALMLALELALALMLALMVALELALIMLELWARATGASTSITTRHNDVNNSNFFTSSPFHEPPATNRTILRYIYGAVQYEPQDV